jgi:hypothetical protein
MSPEEIINSVLYFVSPNPPNSLLYAFVSVEQANEFLAKKGLKVVSELGGYIIVDGTNVIAIQRRPVPLIPFPSMRRAKTVSAIEEELRHLSGELPTGSEPWQADFEAGINSIVEAIRAEAARGLSSAIIGFETMAQAEAVAKALCESDLNAEAGIWSFNFNCVKVVWGHEALRERSVFKPDFWVKNGWFIDFPKHQF